MLITANFQEIPRYCSLRSENSPTGTAVAPLFATDCRCAERLDETHSSELRPAPQPADGAVPLEAQPDRGVRAHLSGAGLWTLPLGPELSPARRRRTPRRPRSRGTRQERSRQEHFIRPPPESSCRRPRCHFAGHRTKPALLSRPPSPENTPACARLLPSFLFRFPHRPYNRRIFGLLGAGSTLNEADDRIRSRDAEMSSGPHHFLKPPTASSSVAPASHSRSALVLLNESFPRVPFPPKKTLAVSRRRDCD